MLSVPGLDDRFPKKEKKGSSLFLIRPLIFSEALGFSLLSLFVNPALNQGQIFFELRKKSTNFETEKSEL